MIEYYNECCHCATENYPCSPYCDRKRVPHYFCDRCGDEYKEDELKYRGGRAYCECCFDELFST